MRRATAAALGTVIGTALLVTAKYGAPSASAGAPTAITAGDPAADGNGAAGSASPVSSAAVPYTSRTAAASAAPTGAVRTTAGGGGGGGATTAPPPPTCSTFRGAGETVPQPGIGQIVVTIKVCNGVISSASATQSQSNWSRNAAALPALNSLTPQYYKTNISAIHYTNASLTSETYQASLKDAMTQARI